MKDFLIDNNTVAVLDTPFCLVITTQKCGTQFLGSFFSAENGTYQLALYYNNKTGKWNTHDTSHSELDYEKSQSEVSFLKFLNDTQFNKDVIVIIRNPWERFVSAWYEDYLKPLLESPNQHIPYLVGLGILDNIPDALYQDSTAFRRKHEMITLVSFWKEHGQEGIANYHRGKDTDFIFKLCLELICSFMVKSYIVSNLFVQQGHNHPYHTLLSSILITSPNLRKVKVFDIDEVDLNEVFNKYVAGSSNDVGYRNASKESKKDYLYTVLNEEATLKRDVTDALAQEILAYQSIKRRAQKENI